MKNYVQAGRLTGAKILYKNNELIFRVKHHEEITIDRSIVSNIDHLGTLENRSFWSALFRGGVGRIFGNNAWLSAIQSAKSNIIHNLRITYRDGSRSIVLVDQYIYLRFMEKF